MSIEIQRSARLMERRLRGEIQVSKAELRGEIRGLRGEIHAVKDSLESRFASMERELLDKFDAFAERIANTMSENLQKYVGAVDDKYKDWPDRHKELRAEFDGHTADLRMHGPTRPAAAKRVRRPAGPRSRRR